MANEPEVPAPPPDSDTPTPTNPRPVKPEVLDHAAPATEKPGDFKTSTRRSVIDVTSKHQPFVDPTSPESLVINEIREGFNNSFALFEQNTKLSNERMTAELGRLTKMVDTLWVRVTHTKPPASEDDVEAALDDAPKRFLGDPVLRAVRLVGALVGIAVVLEIVLAAVLLSR